MRPWQGSPQLLLPGVDTGMLSLPTPSPASTTVSSQWFPRLAFPPRPPGYSALGLSSVSASLPVIMNLCTHCRLSCCWLAKLPCTWSRRFAEYADSPLEEKFYPQELARDLIWLASCYGCLTWFAFPVTGSRGKMSSFLGQDELLPEPSAPLARGCSVHTGKERLLRKGKLASDSHLSFQVNCCLKSTQQAEKTRLKQNPKEQLTSNTAGKGDTAVFFSVSDCVSDQPQNTGPERWVWQ